MKKELVTAILSIITAFSLIGSPVMAGQVRAASDETQAAGTQTAFVTAPEKIRAETTYQSVTLTWGKVQEASGYQVYRADSEQGQYRMKASCSAAQTTFTDQDVTTGKQQYYKIAAIQETETASSNQVEQASDTSLQELKPVAARPQLDRPVISGYAKSRISVRIKWTKVPGAQKYILYKYNKKGNRFQKVKTFSRTKRAYTQKKQKAGASHRYIVRASRTGAGITAQTNSAELNVNTPKKLTMSTKGFWKTNAGKVIKKGKTKRGCPYVWGASGPNAFDCSGFTCWTMRSVGKKVTGVNVGRKSSRTLYSNYSKKYGLGRNLSNAQPGDIIIIGYGGSAASIFHVGIYYDNGKYIHATTGGRGVTVSRIPAGMVVSIIRLPGLE